MNERANEVNTFVTECDLDVSKATSLRMFANWIETLEAEHPHLATRIPLYVSVGLWQGEDAPSDVADWARALAPINKRYYESCIELSRWFGQIKFEVNVSRDLACKKKVVGTRLIEERVIPARIEPAQIEEIVEWECSPLLAPADQRSGNLSDSVA